MIRTFDNFLTTIANGSDDIFFLLLTDKFLKAREIYGLLRLHMEDIKTIQYVNSKHDELVLSCDVSKKLDITNTSDVVEEIRCKGYTIEITVTTKKIEIYTKKTEPTYEHQIDF